MPFTIGGEWIPAEKPPDPKKKVKVILEKRGNSVVTVILNLPMSADKMEEISSSLKKKFGCGGAVKDLKVEIQGDKVSQVQEFLSKLGIK